MSQVTYQGKHLVRESKHAASLNCCCGECPCGLGPPDICQTLKVTITNKTGAAVCLPDEFELEFDGEATYLKHFDGSEFCEFWSVGLLDWFFGCGETGYFMHLSCDPGNTENGERVSQSCEPFIIVFDFSTGEEGSCVCQNETGEPECTHSFRATVTDADSCE